MSNTSSDKDVVVVGAAYPGLMQFLDDYLDSLEAQSCADFDLLIANDGLNGLNALLATRRLSWHTFEVGGSIPSNRRKLIRKAIEMGYGKIIFTDCDDTFENNRVEVAISMLDSEYIVVNDLDITDVNRQVNNPRYFSRRFSANEMITLNSLLAGNMLGLANTAARADVFERCPALISGDSIAFDWYLWSSVLMNGHKARFVSHTSSRYRVYDRSTVGLPQLLNEKNVLKGIEVKKQHYGLMSILDKRYLKLAEEFQWLAKKVEDKFACLEYINILKDHEVNTAIWWENIRTPSEIKFK